MEEINVQLSKFCLSIATSVHMFHVQKFLTGVDMWYFGGGEGLLLILMLYL